jgi:hypothetical protein
MDKVETITNAWKLCAPEASFAGLTLQQFIESMAPCLHVRKELTEIDTRRATLMAQRAEVDKSAQTVQERVVAGVRADIAHGSNSPLWAAMGFVRKSARKKGLTRKSKSPAAQAASPQSGNGPVEGKA